MKAARDYVQQGRRVAVDVDLAKFFDRVNHDILMGRLAKRIADKKVLRLIRRYLGAGVMAHGVVVERHEGTPQGGPFTPFRTSFSTSWGYLGWPRDLNSPNRPVRTRMPGGVGGARQGKSCRPYPD